MKYIREVKESFDYGKSLKKPPSRFIDKIKFVDKYINRPLASVIVRMVYKTPVTPNGLTYFSFLLGIAAAILFSLGEYRYFVLGGISAQLSSVVDGADGMLARAKNKCSRYGQFLDLFFDRIIDFSIICGIAVGAGRSYDSPLLTVLGLSTAGLYVLQINLFYLTKSFLKSTESGETGEARAILWLGVMGAAIADRVDIIIYFLLLETVVVNSIRLFYFVSLREKKSD